MKVPSQLFLSLLHCPAFTELLPAPLNVLHEVDEFLWALSTVLQRSFGWGSAKIEYAMVPYIDLINHRTTASHRYMYRDKTLLTSRLSSDEHTFCTVKSGVVRTMTLESDDHRPAGEQLFISYSSVANTVQMLLQYGFVTPNNPNDYLVLQLRNSDSDPFKANLSAEIMQLYDLTDFGVLKRNGLLPLKFLKSLAFALSGSLRIVHELDVVAHSMLANPHSREMQPRPSGTDPDLAEANLDVVSFEMWSTLLEAYKVIEESTRVVLASYSVITTVEQDSALLMDDSFRENLSRNAFAAVSFRLECKRFVSAVLTDLATNIGVIQQRKFLPVAPDPPQDRYAWPILFVPTFRAASRQIPDLLQT